MNTNMKILRELGIKVVAGDRLSDGSYLTSKGATIYNRSQHEEFELFNISGFKWRDNNGEQPVGDDVFVEIKFNSDYVYTGAVGDWLWGIDGDSDDLQQWRPCLKSLTEVETTPKPKLADVDLDVVIGGEYEYSCGRVNWYKCKILDIGTVGYTVRCPHLESDCDMGMQLISKEEIQFRPIKSERDIAID